MISASKIARKGLLASKELTHPVPGAEPQGCSLADVPISVCSEAPGRPEL